MDMSPTKPAGPFTAALLAYLVACVGQMIFVSKLFGALAFWSSLILAFPLFIGARMHLRWASVRRRELLWLAVLSVFAVTGVVYLVQGWYRSGFDYHHAEDMKYSKLREAMKKDAAFRDLEVELMESKHFYWISGTVESEADLDRLNRLAEECGITTPLRGPVVNSRNIFVKRKE